MNYGDPYQKKQLKSLSVGQRDFTFETLFPYLKYEWTLTGFSSHQNIFISHSNQSLVFRYNERIKYNSVYYLTIEKT